RGAGEPGRADVVRRVVEIRAIAARGERKPPELGHRVRARPHRPPESARAPRGGHRRRRRATRREVRDQPLGLADRRKRLEQSLDVGPDAEVVDLARVQRELHAPRAPRYTASYTASVWPA